MQFLRLFRKSGKRFLKRLFQVTNRQPLATMANATIERLTATRSKSTIDNYRTALRSFLSYAGTQLTLSDIDASTIMGYQMWLRDRGITLNTSSCYMRSLRSLLVNITGQRATADLFSEVFTGNTKTIKRSVSPQDIGRLQQQPLAHHSPLRFFRDIFIFCFYALGMPFVDVAFLRRSQIKDGYIQYHRHKTGQLVRCKIEQPMQDIINKYARKDSDYLFPLLTHTDHRQAMRQYETLLRRYNLTLRKLSQQAGIPHLTSYVARHSWASMAYENNVSLPVISKALGHTSTQTTLIYIRDISDKRIDKANKELIQNMARITHAVSEKTALDYC